MSKKLRILAMSALLVFGATSASHAIVGAGFHWGFDFSLSMDDVNVPEMISGTNDLLGVSRTGFERSVINFGGKAYVDFIPVLPIDAIELSVNFGMWQYDAVLHATNPSDNSIITIPLGVDDVGLDALGVGGTPYSKLHFDLTLRKQLLNLIVLKFDAGLGYSLHFATPLLDAKFVEGMVGNTDITTFLPDSPNYNPAAAQQFGKSIVEKLQDESMSAVHGMHFLLGVKAKLPAIPLGFYLDGKFMIPFSDITESEKGGVKGLGLLINAGISLSI